MILGAAAQGAGGAGEFETLVFNDTFTEASDTELSVHTPDQDDAGGGWTKWDGSSDMNVIASTGLCQPADNTDIGYGHDVGAENHKVEDDTSNTSGAPKLNYTAARLDSAADDYLRARAHQQDDELQLYKVESGSATEIAATAVTISNGDDRRITLTCDGNDITVEMSEHGDYDAVEATINHTLTGGDATNFGSGCGHTEHGVWTTTVNAMRTAHRVYT